MIPLPKSSLKWMLKLKSGCSVFQCRLL